MKRHRILLFDSGLGGLTVARAVAQHMPDAQLVYAADTAAFPYGAWQEGALIERIIRVLTVLIDRVRPDIVVIACNTASTLAMIPVRRTFALPFVGTVPAIKPAAALTQSGIIGVLATPGTVAREYTHSLVQSYASQCRVILHGAKRLAEMAEVKLKGGPLDREWLREEIAPVFQQDSGKRTDIVVLGCTHYPLLLDDIRQVAPWDVTYIDPAPAIARRVAQVAQDLAERSAPAPSIRHGTAFLTSPELITQGVRTAYAAMGFPHLEVVDLPV